VRSAPGYEVGSKITRILSGSVLVSIQGSKFTQDSGGHGGSTAIAHGLARWGHYKVFTSLTSKPDNLGSHVGTPDSLLVFFVDRALCLFHVEPRSLWKKLISVVLI
jgi:hypothetical protein